MGSNHLEGRDDEKLVHRVMLTKGFYQKSVRWRGSHEMEGGPDRGAHPVAGVEDDEPVACQGPDESVSGSETTR